MLVGMTFTTSLKSPLEDLTCRWCKAKLRKTLPPIQCLKIKWINPIILHTGQHYDYELSQAFFEDFNLPQPDIYLGVGSDTNVQQISKIISLSEGVLKDIKPDLVVVFGDVNSTLALAVSTKHLNLNLRMSRRV